MDRVEEAYFRNQHTGRRDAARVVAELEEAAEWLGLPLLDWSVGFHAVSGTPSGLLTHEQAVEDLERWREQLGGSDLESTELIPGEWVQVHFSARSAFGLSRVKVRIFFDSPLTGEQAGPPYSRGSR